MLERIENLKVDLQKGQNNPEGTENISPDQLSDSLGTYVQLHTSLSSVTDVQDLDLCNDAGAVVNCAGVSLMSLCLCAPKSEGLWILAGFS